MALSETSNQTKSLFLGVMGAPYESELCTTVMRMVDEALRKGHHVTVWTCGGATTLTLQSLGESKPRNLLDLGSERGDAHYYSTAALIGELLRISEGRLQWLVCRNCMEERGALEHIAGVKIISAFKFMQCLNQADVAMVMGVK
jgi:sulfur relay (sulfurtransferase) complex TusBCD TusD component (DsrE family)